MNWKNQLGKIIGDGRKTHTYFYQDKRREDDVGKKKSTTPSLAFPFSLNLNKIDNFSENRDMHFGGSGIKKT